jgi:hypothetical protein
MKTQKVRSLLDQTINTTIESRRLVEGEVATIRFKNEPQIEEYIAQGFIELVPNDMPEQKVIPIIGAPEDDQKRIQREIRNKVDLQTGFDLQAHMKNLIG